MIGSIPQIVSAGAATPKEAPRPASGSKFNVVLEAMSGEEEAAVPESPGAVPLAPAEKDSAAGEIDVATPPIGQDPVALVPDASALVPTVALPTVPPPAPQVLELTADPRADASAAVNVKDVTEPEVASVVSPMVPERPQWQPESPAAAPSALPVRAEEPPASGKDASAQPVPVGAVPLPTTDSPTAVETRSLPEATSASQPQESRPAKNPSGPGANANLAPQLSSAGAMQIPTSPASPETVPEIGVSAGPAQTVAAVTAPSQNPLRDLALGETLPPNAPQVISAAADRMPVPSRTAEAQVVSDPASVTSRPMDGGEFPRATTSTATIDQSVVSITVQAGAETDQARPADAAPRAESGLAAYSRPRNAPVQSGAFWIAAQVMDAAPRESTAPQQADRIAAAPAPGLAAGGAVPAATQPGPTQASPDIPLAGLSDRAAPTPLSEVPVMATDRKDTARARTVSETGSGGTATPAAIAPSAVIIAAPAPSSDRSDGERPRDGGTDTNNTTDLAPTDEIQADSGFDTATDRPASPEATMSPREFGLSDRSHGVSQHRASQPTASAPAPDPTPQQAEADPTDAGDDSVKVVVRPDELGRVSMTMQQDGASLRVVVQADRPDTLELLRRNSDHLGQELRDAGFAGASLSFGGREGQASQRPQPAADAMGRLDSSPAISPITSPAAAVASGLDLRI